MSSDKQKCLVCNCENTMPLDVKKLSKALGYDLGTIHTNLCRTQLDTFEKNLKSDEPFLVACTQEAPLFQEIAEENGKSDFVEFINIREAAGWSDEAVSASPKISALIKSAGYKANPARLKSIASDGMCLVYGAGQQALEAAKMLSNKLSVTLLLSSDEGFVLPTVSDIPVYKGKISQASGSFGNFNLIVDGYAPLMPSSREVLNFVMARDGAQTQCSLILDLSGDSPLFSGHSHRDGYFRNDVDDPAGMLRSIIAMSEMVGEFEKPIYVDYKKDTCAHSRSQKQGCNKCLEVCPAAAIQDIGDYIEIDSGVCGGCGSCHSVCPTGAISYQYPDRKDIINRSQKLLNFYHEAGGKKPILLIHDEGFGLDMIAAIARFGKGLPANMIPVSFHSPTILGHVEMASMLVSGAHHIVFITDPLKNDELNALKTESDLMTSILKGLELSDTATTHIICESDPTEVENLLWNVKDGLSLNPSSFTPVATKRDMARLALSALHKQSVIKPDTISLPQNAPYGKLDINAEACTLCMACTSACPTAAITDTPGEPKLRFIQSACVQCGLCVNTCPESALKLVPQLDFTTAGMQPVTLHEEEPFNCISCGDPFATKSTIDRISQQLAGKHSMFDDAEKSKLIQMCDKCRIQAQANSSHNPFSAGERPRPRTTEDYINAEKGNLTADDFLIND